MRTRVRIILKKLKESHIEVKIKILVPVRKRNYKNHKSIPFSTEGMEAIKPFAVYSAKKDDLDLSPSNKSQSPTRRICTEGGMIEHVLSYLIIELFK